MESLKKPYDVAKDPNKVCPLGECYLAGGRCRGECTVKLYGP